MIVTRPQCAYRHHIPLDFFCESYGPLNVSTSRHLSRLHLKKHWQNFVETIQQGLFIRQLYMTPCVPLKSFFWELLFFDWFNIENLVPAILKTCDGILLMLYRNNCYQVYFSILLSLFLTIDPSVHRHLPCLDFISDTTSCILLKFHRNHHY